jgi:hypothetical protein
LDLEGFAALVVGGRGGVVVRVCDGGGQAVLVVAGLGDVAGRVGRLYRAVVEVVPGLTGEVGGVGGGVLDGVDDEGELPMLSYW